ncbi:GNAT family N-acetyltransferase [Celeribacter marinus]|uniref:IAA acetyltransferase n=1 Tax=Celeribacter marinus TaxID=1397108 RepID=A0A0N9ZPL4_9RHOB|nr:GNAT family N-acetyltransferase [Celeribacter marinus]ALI55507.1 IAA acetyltransferase [Celeribacter marinus]SFK20999.1 putative acetyltransferase [Celeribacter marinus]
MIIVELGHPLDPQPAALLAQAQALQAEIYDAEHNHALPTDALAADDVRFFIAREGDVVLGVGAFKIYSTYGEVKSMFTSPDGRGKGIAAALMRAVEDTARAEGLSALKLETGDELDAACRLYERHGFTRCGAFGDYENNGVSVFYEKAL